MERPEAAWLTAFGPAAVRDGEIAGSCAISVAFGPNGSVGALLVMVGEGGSPLHVLDELVVAEGLPILTLAHEIHALLARHDLAAAAVNAWWMQGWHGFGDLRDAQELSHSLGAGTGFMPTFRPVARFRGSVSVGLRKLNAALADGNMTVAPRCPSTIKALQGLAGHVQDPRWQAIRALLPLVVA